MIVGFTTTGFISVRFLEVRIEIDRIEDAKGLFADLRALPRGAAEHLLIKDAAVDPPQENQVLDARHVDAGGQQIDGNRDLRQRIIAERKNQAPDAVHAAGDLADCGILDLAVGLAERLLQLVDDDVGVGIADGKYQCLARKIWIDVPASSSATTRLKGTVTTFLLNSSTLNCISSGSCARSTLPRAGVDQLDCFALSEFDPGLGSGPS